jgi:protein SCO1/2
MRRHAFFSWPVLAVVLAVAALAGACGESNTSVGSSDQHQYSLHGQILALSADHKEANIKHDDIKGFMPAMTMPYKVLDAKEFSAVAPGDVIDATLVVVSNDAYLKDVKKVGHAPLDKLPEDTAPGAKAGAMLLKDGDPVPNTTFLDENGKRRELASFKGSAVVLTFIYTRCPMPTFCPLMDRNFAALQEKLKADRELNVHLLTVSFDPETDTPAVLKKHAQGLHADPKIWTFLTGDLDTIDQFANRFGMSIQRSLDEKQQVNITHNLRTAILDREGNLVKSYTGNDWTPAQVLADIKVLVGVD